VENILDVQGKQLSDAKAGVGSKYDQKVIALGTFAVAGFQYSVKFFVAERPASRVVHA
jgi:hypothetical protein